MAYQDIGRYFRKAYQDFSGGLASRPNPLTVPGNKFVQLDNAIIADHDILEKAPGTTLDGSPFPGTSDSFIRMLVNYKVGTTVNSLVVAAADAGNANANYKVDIKQSMGDGTYQYIGHTTGTALFTSASAIVTGTGTTWTKNLKAGDKIGTGAHPSAWYEILSVDSDTQVTLVSTYVGTTTASTAYMARIILSINSIPVSLVFNNKLFITNGSETPMSFDNTTMSLLQSVNAPKGKYVALHKSRVFVANTSLGSSYLAWSYVNDETSWDATSRMPIFPNDNGNVVRILSYANSLLVFKDNGLIYQVIGEFDQDAYGQPTFVRKLDCPDNVGIIAGNSVVINDDNLVFFLAETGVYTIDPRMYIQKISWDITPDVSNLLLKSTTTATKQFSYTQLSDWNSGTITGLNTSRVTNGISSYFDTLQITDALSAYGAASMAVDSSNNVHIAYITNTGTGINYVKWLASDNTKTTVAVPYLATYGNPLAVAIAIAPNGNVGVMSKHFGTPNAPEYDYQASFAPGVTARGISYYVYSELVSGTWASVLAWNTTATYTFPLYTPIGTPSPQYQDYSANLAAKSINIWYDNANNIYAFVDNGDGYVAQAVTWYVGYGCGLYKRTGSVWATVNTAIAASTQYDSSDIVIDSTNNIFYVAMKQRAANVVLCYKSLDNGTTWTQVGSTNTSLAGTAIQVNNVKIYLNAALQPIITISGTGVNTVYRWNPTLNTTSTYASSSYLEGACAIENDGELLYYSNAAGTETYRWDQTYATGTATFTNGNILVAGTGTKWTTWVKAGDKIKLGTDSESVYGTVASVVSDTSLNLTVAYAGATGTGAYQAKRVITVSNTSNTLTATYSTGAQSTIYKNNVLNTIAFGLNTSELYARRLTLYGKWTSPVSNDSTLSSWGTFTVGGAITGGNTQTFEVGINTGSPIPAGNMSVILPGTIIATSGTNNYASAAASFIFSAFAQSSIKTLAMNYVGAGVDAKIPVGYIFNNEMYLAITQQGQSGNNNILFLDRKHAWGTTGIPVTFMTRYNQILYAGSSTNGNIYKLRQGYNLNGSPYSLTAVTKEDLLGSMELKKDVYKVYVIYQTQTAGSFTFSYRLDNYTNPNQNAWVDQVIDQTTAGIAEVPVGQTCSSIQFKISNTAADQQVGVLGFIVLYGYIGLR